MITTEEIVNVLLLIAIALISARIFGYLFYRLKQPAVLGEIIAGIVVGGIGLYYLHGQEILIFGGSLTLPNLDFHATINSDMFSFVAQLGILFLLFISGLEISVSKLKKMGKTSLFVAIGGVILPFALGFISCFLLNGFNNFSFAVNECIIVGLILTATSVGVTVRCLMDIDALDTDVGATILGSAVFDDIIAILLLAFVLGIGSIMGTIMLGVRIAIFFFLFLYIGLKIIDKILDLGEKIHLPKAFLSISLAILLIYTFFADKAGISGIIGAFVAGVLIGQNVRSVKVEADTKAIAYGFFVPLFFVWVGASLWQNSDYLASSASSIVILASVIIIVAVVGKVIGCGLGAKIAGMTYRQSLQVGVGMIPRMELALIIVSAAISKDILTGNIASKILIVTVILTIVTTLISPLLIRATFKNTS